MALAYLQAQDVVVAGRQVVVYRSVEAHFAIALLALKPSVDEALVAVVDVGALLAFG